MMTSAVGVDIPTSLMSRIPVSLDNLVAEGPEHVNHGSDFDRWRLVGPEGIVVGQVRVYRGRRDERGQRESVFIPARTAPHYEAFGLPYAEAFSTYLRHHLEAYLHSQGDTTPVDAALRKGSTIVGAIGEAYFVRWNVYFKDDKIGEYTIHDMDPTHNAEADRKEGERNYKGRIPGYVNLCVVAWNEIQHSSQYPHLLEEDSVSLRWARLPGEPTLDNRYPFVWKRGDFLHDIPFS